jgi:hypothetical protein
LILENGIERGKNEDGQIPGMFFSYGNHEPLRTGYIEVDGFRNFFVNTNASTDRFCRKAIGSWTRERRL